MTLRRKLAVRYSLIVALCLVLLAGLAHHEFVIEPRMRHDLHIPELPETKWGEMAEVFFYGMIPLILGCGWWLMRRTLSPINSLAQGMQRIHADNLRTPLPRTANGDEIDRLTEVFNAMLGRLDKSIQQIREFTLHASHELKTPLTVMRGQLETALNEANHPEAQARDWIPAQLEEVRRLARIVDTLTLLTQADAGLITLELRPVRLDQLVRECHDDTLILAEAFQVHAVLSECAEVTVCGDRDRLRQLLLNLADNAVKYNRIGGTVAISLRKSGATAELEVSNTGDGIPAELQSKIFDRFVRGNEAQGKAAEGCGLGLAICRWIVESHHGDIHIRTGPNKLTVARVTLPLPASNGN
jgi:signal transduction histidine kinase